jgi:protein-S-isoprenylcysteine O-methyltransferase Ste14
MLNWKNVPIPETHVIPLGIGVILQLLFPWSLPWDRVLSWVLALPLLFLGLLLAAWSVREVSSIDVASPSSLITSGPYSVSRNPMYLAWTLIYLALTLMIGSLWLLILLGPLLVWMHLVILSEERALEKRFGATYRQYRQQVGRYLSLGPLGKDRNDA